MNGKLFAVGTLVALVLLTVAISPISTQQSGSYDPWTDTNDDGIIDVYDLIAVGARFGAEGTPINKTALLLDLQSRVDVLNASLIELQSRKRVVAGQISGLVNLAIPVQMPILSGATGANTIVVASGVGDSGGGLTSLAIRGEVQAADRVMFWVWDSHGNEYDMGTWNSLEIYYVVIDR